SVQEIRQTNVVMQQRDYSCGSASLATLFNYFLKEEVEEREIIKTLVELNEEKGTLEKVIERRGFSLLDLKHFSESKGFVTKGFRLDFEDLVGLNLPAIVPIIPNGYKHFVVFKGVRNGRVFLADPSVGNITEPIEKFKKDWYGFTNVALVIFPDDKNKDRFTDLTLTELDDIYIAGSDVDSLVHPVNRFNTPVLPYIPGEF
ncbi:MAG TPA: C39 family peptidase, partial [Nitrospiria bacterium]